MENKDIELLKNALKDCPDVRIEKVNELKEKIKNGYYVDNKDFAEKLLKKNQK